MTESFTIFGMKPAKTPHETLKDYIFTDGIKTVFDYHKSHGSYFVDKITGKEYLDLFSFFATQPVRFNHPKMVDPTFIEHIGRAALYRPSLSDVYTEEYAEAVETFARVAGKGYFEYYFFVEGGTLGVENALKVAFDWKVRQNLEKGKGEKGSQVIHFKDAFHGRSGYAVSMTNTHDPNKYKYFPKFPWPRVSNPYLRFPVTQSILEDVAKKEEKSLLEIKNALQNYRDDIACLIIEPIQAEGGDNHFRPEFLKALRELSLEEDFLLIFDEVQTGIGLTGEMWGFEHFGFTPDVISFGKKVQVAGCAVTERINAVQGHVFQVPSRINSTWGGNLVDMIRMTRFMRIIEEENLVSNARTMGELFLKKLVTWSGEDSRISNVRGRGLMIAFDLPSTDFRNNLKKALFNQGVLILPCGEKSLRIRPHLDISEKEIEHAMNAFKKSIQTLG